MASPFCDQKADSVTRKIVKSKVGTVPELQNELTNLKALDKHILDAQASITKNQGEEVAQTAKLRSFWDQDRSMWSIRNKIFIHAQGNVRGGQAGEVGAGINEQDGTIANNDKGISVRYWRSCTDLKPADSDNAKWLFFEFLMAIAVLAIIYRLLPKSWW